MFLGYQSNASIATMDVIMSKCHQECLQGNKFSLIMKMIVLIAMSYALSTHHAMQM